MQFPFVKSFVCQECGKQSLRYMPLTFPTLAALIPQIRQSRPVPLFKVFLVYDSDWWTDSLGTQVWPNNPPGAWPAFTRMTTDMPMRGTCSVPKLPPAQRCVMR